MTPTLSAIGDSITFIEDQLESAGIFPYANTASDETEISTIGNLAERMVRLRRTLGSRPVLETVQYERVADCFSHILEVEIATAPIPKPIGTATDRSRQLSLFDDDQFTFPNVPNAA